MARKKIPMSAWHMVCDKLPHPVALTWPGTGRIAWVNYQFSELTGYSFDELVRNTKNWKDLVPLTDHGAIDSGLADLAENRHTEFYLETEFERKSGVLMAVELYVYRYPLAEEVVLYVFAPAEKQVAPDWEDLREEFRTELEELWNVVELQNEDDGRSVKDFFKFCRRYWPLFATVGTALGGLVTYLARLLFENIILGK